MHIVLIGLPGCGKGTQVNLLREAFGNSLHVISTGDLLRKRAEEPDATGLLIRDKIKTGNLVPASIVNDIITYFISQRHSDNDVYVWDGYPRDCDQANNFIRMTEASGIQKSDIILVDIFISEDLAINRITSRYQCIHCGAIYSSSDNIINNQCQKCDNKIEKRIDDNYTVAKNRIQVSRFNTDKMISFLRLHNIKYHKIDGSMLKHEVFNMIYSLCRW